MCLYIIVYGHNTLSIVMGRSKRIVALYYNYFFENVGEVYDYTALHCTANWLMAGWVSVWEKKPGCSPNNINSRV